MENFNKEIAIKLGGLIQIAYELFEGKITQLNDSLRKYELSPSERLEARPKSNAEKEVFGFIAKNDTNKTCYIAFRGTQTFEDWLANLTFEQTSHDGGWGKVEHGFQYVYQQCSATIKKALNKDYKIYITGHSLGGALATLCAADLKSDIKSSHCEIELYTFASPRVGDKEFAKRCNLNLNNAFRIVNVEDIVNTLPVATPLIKAFHVPGIVDDAIDELKKILNVDGIPEGHNERRNLLSFLTDFNYQHIGSTYDFSEQKGNIKDNHDMETYLAKL